MTQPPHHGELRRYSGSIDRPRPIFDEHVFVWDSRVTITPLHLAGHGHTHEIRVTRHGGPKLSGTPDPVGVRIAQVDDVIAERNPTAAREIALRACDELRNTRAPDLKALQVQVSGPRRASDL